MPKPAQLVTFFGISATSLVLLFFVFEYQYMWHVRHAQYLLLRGGFGLGVLALIMLWAFFPSYWAVMGVAIVVLTFPALVPDVPSLKVTPAFSAIMLVSLVLLITTTYVRRRWYPV